MVLFMLRPIVYDTFAMVLVSTSFIPSLPRKRKNSFIALCIFSPCETTSLGVVLDGDIKRHTSSGLCRSVLLAPDATASLCEGFHAGPAFFILSCTGDREQYTVNSFGEEGEVQLFFVYSGTKFE